MKNEKYVAYVGTYTYENSVGIHIYDLDVEKGSMAERKVVPINNPSDLIVSNNGKYLYSIADEGVESFKILPDGDLEPINVMWNGGMRGCYVELDDEDRFLFVGGYHDGRVSMMELNPEDGSIVGIADGVFHKAVGRSVADRSSRPHVNCVKVTPDQNYLCAVDGGLDHVKVYKIDYANKKLKMQDIVRGDLDSAPRMIRFSHDGKYAYILNELENTVDVFTYRVGKHGTVFERIQSITTEDKKHDSDICSATCMEFSPDGKYLYVSNGGVNSVVIYARDDATGKLSLVCNSKVSGQFPKALAIFPDGKHFVCLNHESNSIGTFAVDYEKRIALMAGKPIKIETPNCIYIHKLG